MVVVRGDGKEEAGPPWVEAMEVAVKGDNLRKMMEKDEGDGGKGWRGWIEWAMEEAMESINYKGKGDAKGR